jgi:hypothetical protein
MWACRRQLCRALPLASVDRHRQSTATPVTHLMKSSLVLPLAILVVGFASTAGAESRRRAHDAQFQALDTNEDRRLSEREFLGQKTGEAKERSKRQFKELDRDGDEELSVKEYRRIYSLSR